MYSLSTSSSRLFGALIFRRSSSSNNNSRTTVLLQKASSPTLSLLVSAAAFSTQPKKFYKKSKQNKDELRADRVLANRSGKSRSECHDLLVHKRIWRRRDNSNPAENEAELTVVPGPSSRLPMNAALFIDGVHEVPLLSKEQEQMQTALRIFHKPLWVLSVTNDPKYNRPCLDDTILPTNYHPVGRLDYDTSGLLLFSNVGALTQNILHPKQLIEKEYVATVVGQVNRTELAKQLKAGVQTSLGIHKAKILECQVHDDPAMVSSFVQNILDSLPYNKTDLTDRGVLRDYEQLTHMSTIRLIVTEGKNRMVRRMLANCGHPVIALHRERIGEIRLGDLPVGEQREWQEHEKQWARSLIQKPTGNKKKYHPKNTKRQ